MNYEASMVNLGKQHLTLLRPFLYAVWMQAKKYPQVTTDTVVLGYFQAFVQEHLEPLVQYQIKHVQKSSSSPMKLIVDEGDLAKADAPAEKTNAMDV